MSLLLFVEREIQRDPCVQPGCLEPTSTTRQGGLTGASGNKVALFGAAFRTSVDVHHPATPEHKDMGHCLYVPCLSTIS